MAREAGFEQTRGLISDLAATTEDLQEALDRTNEAAASRAEESAVRLLPKAMVAADEDLSELAVYTLSLLRQDATSAVLETVRSVVGDNEEQFERIWRILKLSDNAFVDQLVDQVVVDQLLMLTTTTAFSLSGAQYSHPLTPAKSNLGEITTIVHGTWAKRSQNQTEWWEPHGNFAQHVANTVTGFYTDADYFYWSGANKDLDRRQAAHDLGEWVSRRLAFDGDLRLICHSHGGNVALLAAQMGLHINKLVLLGTPIRTDYLPRMDRIDKIISIFSPTDPMQTRGTMGRCRAEGRTLADATQIQNFVTANPKSSHLQLHEWAIWTDQDNRFDRLL